MTASIKYINGVVERIVDDYYQFEECRQAIDEYRDEHGIDDELVRIDNCSVYWRRK